MLPSQVISTMENQWSAQGPFTCGLCQNTFSRKATIQDPHFASCVRKLGNPNNLVWDSHPTCWRKGRTGPSGLPAPGSLKAQRAQQPQIAVKHEESPVLVEDTLAETMSNVQLTPGRTLTAACGWTANNGIPVSSSDRSSASNTIRDISSSNRSAASDTGLEISISPSAQSSNEHPTAAEQDPTLNWQTMNRLVNIPILASRHHAGKGDEEAAEMWEMWTNLLPEGFNSSIEAPTAGCGEKARQQAVVWLAQDVYTGLMGKEQTLQSQLAWITVWREVVGLLDDDEGVAKIHDLLIEALGQAGPMMLF